ncbi:hypothetical protein [Pseudodesulfovibrio sp. JC047]|uniref:hypothetical protein n=1 Tax=Pseudodesulfovibrio sp. JC047 TaxID=2683199 RepID=UPI001EF29E48|nr:hypothetical protein [Pseudodesulfovibrio sp. JC047]
MGHEGDGVVVSLSSMAIHVTRPTLAWRRLLVSVATAMSVSTTGHSKTVVFKVPGSPCVDDCVELSTNEWENDNISCRDRVLERTRYRTAYQDGHMFSQKGLDQSGR